MCDALRELMKPEFDEALDKAVHEAVQEALDEQVKKMGMEMIRNGEPDAKIIRYTKLTQEQVTELREENDKSIIE